MERVVGSLEQRLSNLEEKLAVIDANAFDQGTIEDVMVKLFQLEHRLETIERKQKQHEEEQERHEQAREIQRRHTTRGPARPLISTLAPIPPFRKPPSRPPPRAEQQVSPVTERVEEASSPRTESTPEPSSSSDATSSSEENEGFEYSKPLPTPTQRPKEKKTSRRALSKRAAFTMYIEPSQVLAAIQEGLAEEQAEV
jgi:hypothetical protein